MQIKIYLTLPLAILLCSVIAIPQVGLAQERDTSEVRLEQDEESRRSINLDRQYERSISGGSMTEMGTYNVPSETQYYERPFKGQEYLDMAVEAYREEIEDKMGGSWYWDFLKAVSPFIRMELGAFQTMELEYPDKDNPLWQSYTNDEKIE